MGSWVKVAYLTKVRNVKGSLVAREADGLPFLLSEGMKVSFVPPTLRGPRTAEVESCEPLGSSGYNVHFKGIDGIDDAEQIVGCYCLTSAEDAMAQQALEQPSVVGMNVVDVAFGTLGTVVDVEGSSLQDILVVSGDQGRILIPAVDSYIVDIDDEGDTITVSIPRELKDLNRDTSCE